MPAEALVIEGYASLVGVVDLAGGAVRAGAPAWTLRTGRNVPMLLSHVGEKLAGPWAMMREDGRELFVRRLVTAETPAGCGAEADWRWDDGRAVDRLHRDRLVAAGELGPGSAGNRQAGDIPGDVADAAGRKICGRRNLLS